MSASYELTPLLKWSNTLVLSLSNRSRYLASKYRFLPNSRHVALQWFF